MIIKRSCPHYHRHHTVFIIDRMCSGCVLQIPPEFYESWLLRVIIRIVNAKGDPVLPALPGENRHGPQIHWPAAPMARRLPPEDSPLKVCRAHTPSPPTMTCSPYEHYPQIVIPVIQCR